ncbi:MAG TPA: hypothetical protein DEQ34_05485 [Balneolaceae bacterium]|nr:hypothetical protein [Balneolaceae bacterium]|tara:strand:- start:49929 stop:50216 length:288 start_codon:yes stop_codon:yes gene_type:complete
MRTYRKNGKMLIGGDFNKKGVQLLKTLSEMSQKDIDADVAVGDLNRALKFDRNEIKNLLEYLENKECVQIKTIGGPYLYGHISITSKGLIRAVRK